MSDRVKAGDSQAITPTITRASADRLGLEPGIEAAAVIKARRCFERLTRTIGDREGGRSLPTATRG